MCVADHTDGPLRVRTSRAKEKCFLTDDGPFAGCRLSRAELLKKIAELTEGGADYSIEATGAAPCIKAAWEVSDGSRSGVHAALRRTSVWTEVAEASTA